MDWLLAGLGNPGPEYAETRHNAGSWLVERLAGKTVLRPERRWRCLFGRIAIGDAEVGLCVPQDYMNRSGGPVVAVAQFYKLAPERILVAHDDLDLPPGTVRLKRGGGHGGHNGLRDLDLILASRDYWRLRIGIGHPGHKTAVVGYVLGRPEAREREAIGAAIGRAIDVLPDFFAGRWDKAQHALHSFA